MSRISLCSYCRTLSQLSFSYTSLSRTSIVRSSIAVLNSQLSDSRFKESGARGQGALVASSWGKRHKFTSSTVSRRARETIAFSNLENDVVAKGYGSSGKLEDSDKEQHSPLAEDVEDADDMDDFLPEDALSAEEMEYLAEEDGDEFVDEDDFEDLKEPQRGDGEGGGGLRLGDVPWGPVVLRHVEEELASPVYSNDLVIYALRIIPSPPIVRVRLDKLSDKYGSPTLDDIGAVTRALEQRFEQAALTNELPGDIMIEVSSPGAERVLQIPEDLGRFQNLPMMVRYRDTGEDGQQEAVERDAIFGLVEWDDAQTVWRLANVRRNREALGKGRVLNKKMRETLYRVQMDALLLVRLHIDV